MDTKKIEQIITLFEGSKVASMELEIEDIKIKLKKHNEGSIIAQPQMMPAPTLVSAPVETRNEVVKEMKAIKSPLVGTFYASPSPDSSAFVSVGSQVNKGDVVCIVEAMKVMNEIKADQSGVVKEICVQDGDMVQFDQPIFLIGDAND